MKLGSVHISTFTFDVDAIFRGELWRLVTCFLVFTENFNIYFIFNIFFTVHVSEVLEQTCRTWLHYLWCLLLGCFAMIFISFFVHFIGYVPGELPLLSNSLNFFLIYLWSKRHRDQHVGLMFVIVIRVAYLPWIYLLIDTMLHHEGVDDIYGLIVGHVFYWFEDVFPMYYKWNPLGLPKSIENMVFPRIDLHEGVELENNENQQENANEDGERDIQNQ
ncbi:Derlin [Entamoeba marina]